MNQNKNNKKKKVKNNNKKKTNSRYEEKNIEQARSTKSNRIDDPLS